MPQVGWLRRSATGRLDARARARARHRASAAAVAAVLAMAATVVSLAVPAAAKPPGGTAPGQLKKLLGDTLDDVRAAVPEQVGDVVEAIEPPIVKKVRKALPPQARAPERAAPHAPPAEEEPPEATASGGGGAPAGAEPSPSTGGGASVNGSSAEPLASGQRRQPPAEGARGAGDRSPGEGAAAGGGAGAAPPPVAADEAPAPSATTAPAGDGEPAAAQEPAEDAGIPVVRTVRDIVEVFPGWAKLVLAALVALCLALAGAYAVSALRARSLARQRSELLRDVGLLQGALLPHVPDELGALATSVAYRPADGPAAGGDFYDALPLSGGRVGFVLGDVSGHGRDALERTAFVRHSLRAYLKADLDPRVALQVAGRVIGDSLGDDFVTVLIAVHDPASGTLTYAGAGHAAPIVTGDRPFEPVLAGGSPPIGFGMLVGQRQTTVPLPPGAVACLYTDGLVEARTDEGLLGREGLERIVRSLGPGATAEDVIAGVASAARSATDDMAVCLLTPNASVAIGGFRTEQLDLAARELEGPLLGRFLEQCGVGEDERFVAEQEAHALGPRFGGVHVTVVLGSRRTVEVLPRNVESLEAAARRASAA